MVLSDRDIRERLAAGDLKIEPMLDARVPLQPASIDLRLRAARMSSPAERPYGKARGSTYDGQSGPQVSRLRLDEA